MKNDKVEIIYGKGEVGRFQIDILEEGLIDLFFPASFISADGAYGGVFYTSSYYPLYGAGEIKASTLIGMASSIIEKAERAERRYFFKGEYEVSEETVYINSEAPVVKLIYKPVRGEESFDLTGSVKKMMCDHVNEAGDRFIKEAISILDKRELSSVVTANELGKLEKKAFSAGE